MKAPLPKFFLFLLLFASYPLLSGMICDRAIDISILVKNTSKFRLNFVEALTKAGIPAQDGKVPANFNGKTINLSYTDTIDLVNNPRSQEMFQKYGSKIHSIYINRIWLTVDKNTFKVDLPEVKVAIVGLKEKFDETQPSKNEIATFLPVGAGQTDLQATLLWEPDGYQRAIEYLKKYGLQLRLTAPFTVKSGMAYPKSGEGIMDFSLQIEMTFVIKAI